MSGFSRRYGVFGALVVLLHADQPNQQDAVPPGHIPPAESPGLRLPNGKLQRDEILRVDYEQNVKDAAELSQQVSAFQLELEKSDRYVLSLALLKKLGDIEKLTKRIHSRMKR